MTIAQKLEQKGRQEGRKEGFQEAALKIAHAMLSIGIDRKIVMKTTGLNQGEFERIRR
ncbi:MULTISPECIES: hypothetical protein [Photorhabdus]|nr:putative transposase/invertase (TIGR01784 family) [Photorhabdus asymbiotica]